MADINFDCPFCGQNLDAPEDMAGWAIDCPACGRKIKIPVPEGMVPDAAVDTSQSPDKATTGLIDQAGDPDRKDATVRIDVPEAYRPPPPSQRVVKIKRLGH